MGSTRRADVRWLLAVALLAAGCGDPAWTEWTPIDGSPAVDATVIDAVGSSIIVGDVGADAADASDASDARDGDASDASDASDGDASDGDAASFELDVTTMDVGAPGVDVVNPVDVPIVHGSPMDVPIDRGIPIDVGVDVPVDLGSPIDVPIDRGNPIDVPMDRGNPIDAGSPIDVPIDRGSPIDVPIDRGSPIDVGVDVPIDRGNPIDVGVDVPIDRGNPIDVGVDVPIDRGSPVDVGVDVPIDRGSPVDVGVDVAPVDTGGTGVPASDPVAYSGSFAARTGRFTATLTVQGERRSVVLAVPTGAVTSPPLLMIFHGTNGDGSVAMTESNAQALANSAGVIVAAPTSRWRPVGDFDHATEETYWETAPNADINNNQDLVLVRAIMVEAQRAYGVDPMRVYAMGHSNGAFFAQFVAVLLRDRIAAFSENSGGLVRCGRTTACGFQGSGTTCAALRTQSGYCSCAGAELAVAVPTSGRMPPGLLTHGTRDPMVSVYYTCTLAELMTARGHTQVTRLFDGEGHGVPTNWAQLVWPFFATRRLGDR